MLHCCTRATLFMLALASAPAAQSLAGKFQLDGNPDFVMYVVPSPIGVGGFFGEVWYQGRRLEAETFYACLVGVNRYAVENLRGNRADLVVDSEGHLAFEVTTGPNAGRKTVWVRQ